MRRIAMICLSFCCFVCFCACGADMDYLMINYGVTEVYESEELEDAVAVIKEKFEEFEGCKLHSLKYVGDEASQKYCDSLGDDTIDQCVVFESSFQSPEDGGENWEPDTEYNWKWYLGRQADDTEWTLLDFGD